MLKIAYLPVNQMWVVTDNSGQEVIGIGPTNQMFFKSKKELRGALKQCKLTLKGNQVVGLN